MWECVLAVEITTLLNQITVHEMLIRDYMQTIGIMISFFAFVDTFFELRRLLPGGRRFLRVWKHEQVKPKAVFATYLVYDLLTTMTS